MDIKVFVESGTVPVTVMHVDGNIDASTYTVFQEKARELIEGGAHFILVDLEHAPYVSSAGMRALQSMYDQLRTRYPDLDVSNADVKKGISAGTYKSPHLKLLNPSKESIQTFEMTGLDMFIEIFTDKAAALASF